MGEDTSVISDLSRSRREDARVISLLHEQLGALQPFGNTLRLVRRRRSTLHFGKRFPFVAGVESVCSDYLNSTCSNSQSR